MKSVSLSCQTQGAGLGIFVPHTRDITNAHFLSQLMASRKVTGMSLLLLPHKAVITLIVNTCQENSPKRASLPRCGETILVSQLTAS